MTTRDVPPPAVVPRPSPVSAAGPLLKRRRLTSAAPSQTAASTASSSAGVVSVPPRGTAASLPPCCAACDQIGHDASACPFFAGKAREAHPDGALGDTVPHMFQIEVQRDGAFFFVDGRRFRRGYASGRANNCLIDTLRQKLELICNVDWARSQLQVHFSEPGPGQVTAANFLTLDIHWARVVDLLFQNAGRTLRSDAVRIARVDAEFLGNGDVLGAGALTLNIALESGNRFVPLIPMRA